MWNTGGFGYPQQPIIFIPTPGNNNSVPGFDIDGITRQIAGLEALKKLMKEEKKDGGDKKKEQPNVFSIMLLMILVAPITGPIMSKFFSLGLSYLPH